MFNRTELVVLIGVLLAVCLRGTAALTARLTPEHLHSAPGGVATFTCEADEVVSACEFLVRFKNKDLAVVDLNQTQSGVWDLGSSARGSAVGGGVVSGGVVPGRAPTGRDDRPTGRYPTTGKNVDDAVVGGEGGRSSTRNRQTQAAAASQLQFAEEDAAARSTSRQTRPSTASWNSGNDRPVFSLTTTAPRGWGTSQANRGGEANGRAVDSNLGRKRSVVVLGAKDQANGGELQLSMRASPYPADQAQTIRRRHPWARGTRKPGRQRPSGKLASRFNNQDQDQPATVAPAGYRWQGNATPSGGCTLTLPVVQEGRHVIGCRVRRAKGGWEYALASLHVNRYKPMGLKVQALPVAKSGSSIPVTFTSTVPMRTCFVGPIKGALPTQKMCRGNAPALPGPVWITGHSGKTYQEARAVFVRVSAPPPASIDFELPKTRFMEGEYFTATCTVGPAQPPANLTWYLGEEELRADADDDFPGTAWTWPWEGRGLSQSIHLTVTSDDDQLKLACHVAHPENKNVLEKGSVLRVTQDDDDGTSECGVFSVSTRLMGGVTATEAVPWAVAVYQRMRGGDMEHVCGGTLVSRRLVVSSAQCFWDPTFARVADAANFRVAVGKRMRSWLPLERDAQTPGIVRIAVPKHFLGRQAHYVYDIAVVVLDAPVTLSDNVVPACIDRTGTLPELQPDDMGVVAGWGVTESGRHSSGLRSIELPYVDTDVCFGTIEPALHRFLSYDKFCAGFINQSKSVCPGDSGGGLVFMDEGSNRHYIRGVASVAFAPFSNSLPCFADLYTGFTMISEYASWIFKQAPPTGHV